MIESSLNLRDDITVIFISHIENCGTDMDPNWRLYTTGKYFACITPNSVKSVAWVERLNVW